MALHCLGIVCLSPLAIPNEVLVHLAVIVMTDIKHLALFFSYLDISISARWSTKLFEFSIVILRILCLVYVFGGCWGTSTLQHVCEVSALLSPLHMF